MGPRSYTPSRGMFALPAWEPGPEDEEEELHASSSAADDGTVSARAAPRRSI
jgi:hypothetical protein